MFICHLYDIFGEVSVKVFDPFFNWLVLFFYCLNLFVNVL